MRKAIETATFFRALPVVSAELTCMQKQIDLSLPMEKLPEFLNTYMPVLDRLKEAGHENQ